MAVPGMKSASMALFQRIPEQLFSPLGSANRRVYWSLLCGLHRSRFGPDAPMPPSYGFLQRDIIKDIEDHLTYETEWEVEDGDQPDSSINVRANSVFNRMVKSGWFRLDKHGMEKTINMAPAVGQLLSLLVNFAETGPIFVSGKIRSIEGLLSSIKNGDGSGAELQEAAEQARNLFVHIRNTGTNVRDLMASIAVKTTTAQYVRSFFKEYIEQVFIGDYQELRTREHPLARRPQILSMVEHFSTDSAHRERLIEWYEQRMASGDRQQAEKLFDRALRRLFELDRIDEYLERLDDAIRYANKRALAFLDYRLRSLRPVDHLIQKSIDHLIANGTDGIEDVAPVFGPDMLISGDRLVDPKRIAEQRPASPLRQLVISDRTRALGNLMRRARDARSMTTPKLLSYAFKSLDNKNSISSSQLLVTSIEEVRAYQVLNSIAMGMGARSPILLSEARRQVPRLEVQYTSTVLQKHTHLSGKPFEIKRRHQAIPIKDKT
jgi:Family of unknown function (DUF5716)